MKKTSIIILLFSISLLANAENANVYLDTFKLANEAYKTAKYEEAIMLYKQVLANDYESSELYYNLGNAYYKTKDLTNAILYYQKALRLNPTNEEIKFNLRLANLRIIDKIEPLPELFFTQWWNSLIYAKSTDGWGWMSIESLFLCFLLAVGFMLTDSLMLKKLAFYVGILSLIVSVLCFVLGKQQKDELINQNKAIVFAQSLTVRSSPDEKGTQLFVIHEGTKVEMLETVGEWTKIKIVNGNTGWVKIEILSPI